ncbi:MAG: glutamate racemase [Sphingomonadales bacterium]|nr:glutamate racemase [Sphingomonadales bacterium]PIX66941.1 MAG: glutamate racemase [Sphingomonadales bacterium CG_4_10_14_3_um_filter_58_15]NCO48566.1 glutamate racemase [Sphingomonadales bacterium]NCO99847.1 glutamate racemase [Sphingomonadales bacterium]NCP26511.1 glutamate racemase [Sphingomonadales bacterium]
MTKAQIGDCPPLLFFDTGVGGLSVLRETIKLLPNAPIVYAADYAGLPYGMKSEAELAARVPALLGRLVERYKPILATIACNTASTITLDHVRSALNIPVVGTVPAIKTASQISKTGVIGLLGTRATVRQPYVDRLAADFASDKILLRHAAPDLVYAAEAKLRGEKPDPAAIEQAISGLIRQDGGDRMDTVILACTHFPLLRDELTEAAPRPMQFIDGAEGIAQRIAYLTQEIRWPDHSEEGIFVTTGDLADITPYRAAFKDYGIGRFESL